jgi:hypothetical protein
MFIPALFFFHLLSVTLIPCKIELKNGQNSKVREFQHGRPQTFFQGRVKFPGGGAGQEHNYMYLPIKHQKDTI